MTKQEIIKLGGKEWTGGVIERVYITNDILNKLDEQHQGYPKFYQPHSYGERNNKLYYDVKTNKVMRQYKGKRISVMIDFNN